MKTLLFLVAITVIIWGYKLTNTNFTVAWQVALLIELLLSAGIGLRLSRKTWWKVGTKKSEIVAVFGGFAFFLLTIFTAGLFH